MLGLEDPETRRSKVSFIYRIIIRLQVVAEHHPEASAPSVWLPILGKTEPPKPPNPYFNRLGGSSRWLIGDPNRRSSRLGMLLGDYLEPENNPVCWRNFGASSFWIL